MKTTTKTKTLSLGDFKRYVDQLQYDCIWYDERLNDNSPVYLSLSFNELYIRLCPDVIMLKDCKDGDNTLLFYGVHKIEIEDFVLGTIAYITCIYNGELTRYSILFKH